MRLSKIFLFLQSTRYSSTIIETNGAGPLMDWEEASELKRNISKYFDALSCKLVPPEGDPAWGIEVNIKRGLYVPYAELERITRMGYYVLVCPSTGNRARLRVF